MPVVDRPFAIRKRSEALQTRFQQTKDKTLGVYKEQKDLIFKPTRKMSTTDLLAFPELTAIRLYDRGREPGYPGPPAQIRTCALTHPAPALGIDG